MADPFILLLTFPNNLISMFACLGTLFHCSNLHYITAIKASSPFFLLCTFLLLQTGKHKTFLISGLPRHDTNGRLGQLLPRPHLPPDGERRRERPPGVPRPRPHPRRRPRGLPARAQGQLWQVLHPATDDPGSLRGERDPRVGQGRKIYVSHILRKPYSNFVSENIVRFWGEARFA